MVEGERRITAPEGRRLRRELSRTERVRGRERIMEKRRIGVLTGGGDCAGLNPAIKWVVKTALDDRLQKERKIQYEVIGIRDGWKGLVSPDGNDDAPASRICTLTEEMVRTWDRYGGTNLGTSRTNPY